MSHGSAGPLSARSNGGALQLAVGHGVSAMGDRTAPGAGAASAGTSTDLERSGFVLVSLILVAA